MGKKNKIKLTEEQKEWADNLQWFLNHKVCWTGETSPEYFKEMVQDGKYAVLSSSGAAIWDHFSTVICTDTFESAKTIDRWNPSSLSMIIHLGTLWIEKETRRLHSPYFSTLVEKWDYDKELERYKELKNKLKPVLKAFKIKVGR